MNETGHMWRFQIANGGVKYRQQDLNELTEEAASNKEPKTSELPAEQTTEKLIDKTSDQIKEPASTSLVRDDSDLEPQKESLVDKKTE